MALGGLGAAMFSSSSALASLHLALRKVDLQSMFFASLFIILLVVLAYLTNPSETSFRTYLTEQSFRQHLRRLDDDNGDDSDEGEVNGVHYTLTRRSNHSSNKPPRSYSESNLPFHFVNRASVSLRTPKHVFHSFGILTIAAIVPRSSATQHRADGNPRSLVSDSWYIGAFGKWWRGGYIQRWWLNSIANTKDAERCNSGILDLKALDSLECYDGLPYAVPSLPAHLTPKESPSKTRDSVRPGHRTGNGSARNSSPPPLPKSASLPLHAPPPSKGDKASTHRNAVPTPQQQPPVIVSNGNSTAAASPQIQSTPSALFDQSPVISDILRQISASKSAVHDLHVQLSEFRSAAAASRSHIQGDLEVHRERKRAEDAARNELKARTKALEDSKRGAEAVRRDVEKKLKAAETARTNASERIERLDKEICELKQRMQDDERAIRDLATSSTEKESEIQQELDRKRKEIKVAEDVVAALNTRAKELEDKIAQEEERLAKAKEQAELRRQDRAFYPLHVVHSQEASPRMAPWSPISTAPESELQDPHAMIHTDRSQHIDVFTTQPLPHHPGVLPGRRRGGSGSSGQTGPTDFAVAPSPRPKKLSLGILSNFREHHHHHHPENTLVPQQQMAIRSSANGFPPGSGPTPPMSMTRFSPFSPEDNEVEISPTTGLHHDIGIVGLGAPSPKSTSLIPMSLIQSLEAPSSGIEELSRRLPQSEPTNDFDWPRKGTQLQPSPFASVEGGFSSSPTSLDHPGFDGIDREDPFEIRPPPPLPLRRRFSTVDDIQHQMIFPHPDRTSSDPQPLVRARTRELPDDGGNGNGTGNTNVNGHGHGYNHRRWFHSSKDNGKEKKGLNPEAKVFQLKKPSFPFPFPHNTNNTNTNNNNTNNTSLLHLPLPHHMALPPPSHVHLGPHQHQPSLPLPPPSSSGTAASTTDSVFSTLSMRAFAPSPAEREALTRALGSSSNTSFERLPTLSEVSIGSSMPPSPSPPAANASTNGVPAVGMGNKMGSGSSMPPGLAWLQSLPRMRRTSKFSPWEDEEPSTSTSGSIPNPHTSF